MGSNPVQAWIFFRSHFIYGQLIACDLFVSSSTGVSPSLGWNDSFDSKAVLTWCIIHPSCWWSWTRLCCWSKRKDFDSGPSWMDCTPALFKVRLVNIGPRCIHVWGFKTSSQLPEFYRLLDNMSPVTLVKTYYLLAPNKLFKDTDFCRVWCLLQNILKPLYVHVWLICKVYIKLYSSYVVG